MKHETMDREIARRSALIYVPITLGAIILFLLAATVIGGYPLVAQIGGAVWIGLLMMIVSMPVVTGEVKKRLMQRGLSK